MPALDEPLAIAGGSPAVSTPLPHFNWPPAIPGLSGIIADYIETGQPLSIVGRSGVFEKLEDRLAGLMGRKYAILMSSGTMALYSAYFALDLKPDDEVICTVYSFHATATPLLHLGVKIVFCDVEQDTGNIDPELIEALITPRTRAVVTNHMWGHPVDCAAIRAICDKHGLAWVEDCSHAHFSEFRGRYVGGFGDVAIFSLQGNKLLTGGEGGVLLTDSQDVYERATLLGHSLKRSEQCVTSPRWKDILRTGFGLKFRMHPLAAVMVLHLLKNHCFDWIESRTRNLAYFSEGLAALEFVSPMARKEYVTSMGAHYGFKPRIDFHRLGVSRTRLVAALQAEGLDVDEPGSPPLHRLAIFDSCRFPLDGADLAHLPEKRNFPGADEYYGSILSLPTFTFDADRPLIDGYIEAFRKVINLRSALP